mgnify:CR=1 FL=1
MDKLDTNQVAKLTGLKPRTVREVYKDKPGFPRPFYIGRYYWDKQEVVKWIRKQRV